MGYLKEMRLKWYGHVMARDEHCVGRRVMGMELQRREEVLREVGWTK